MVANIDTTAGKSSFVSAREDAWHHLGITLPDTFTAEEAMEHGLLGGWNVRKQPIFAALDNGLSVPVPGRFAVVRDNPVTTGQVDVLGDVGSVYEPIQNEEHAELLNMIVDESGAHFETAGAINGGRTVFITMKLPGFMKVGGQDQVDVYLAAINSHDGGWPFTVLVTPIRIVCQNTLNIALEGANQMFRVRHTRNARAGLVGEARRVLDLTFDYVDAFQSEADHLIDTTLTTAQFEQIIAREFGAAEDAAKATVTRAEKRLDEMSALFADAQTQDGIRDTAWAGFNALTEWADHFSPSRGDEADDSRAARAVLDPAFKNRALALMKAVA